MPNYYPVMLDVRWRPVMVIGGDRVAAEKAAALAACGARVSVLSEEFCAELLAMSEQGKVALVKKVYAEGDLAGAFVVVAATQDARLAQAIWEETQRRGQLVNVVDVPTRCTFIVPSILRRDQLTVAVSTEGTSPGLAKRIRQRLEVMFPVEYGMYLRLAAAARALLREQGVSYARRDDFCGNYFRSDVLELLVEGHVMQAAELTAALLKDYGVAMATHELANAVERPASTTAWLWHDKQAERVQVADSLQEIEQ